MTLPTGTVTFLFTDIEGSTRQWDAHPEAMAAALRRHDTLMREAIESNGGSVFKAVGDAFCAAFPTPLNALAATLTAQLALQAELWPEPVEVRVRMALHAGTAEERDGDYFGPSLNRVARLLSLGYGGQTLLSQITHDLIRDSLSPTTSVLDLGLHRLKDLQRPEQVFQLNHPDLPAAFPALRSLDNPQLPNNLPRQLTSFIGREKEIAEVKALLAKSRLLTLTGSGGCGKTRLSLQVAADVLEDYPDGVWLVELASLTDPALVPQTVAMTLSIREAPTEPITTTLVTALKSRQMLLVLDNCEHLLQASATLVDALLRGCPKVRVLVSSREALGIGGESTYGVPSLTVPDVKHTHSPQSLSEYESVRLFIERAVAARSDFTVTASNASSLASVCHHLDGIPLAIELAAARVRAMPVDQIEARLDSRFRLLTGGSRTALPRQQTLKALIDWSYDLLNEQERSLLCWLSVFAGGWRLEAAEGVCAGEGTAAWEVLDLLTSLVDKSLVVYVEREGKARYRMLETVRQYARDRLEESGESDAVRERHRDYCLAFAEEAEPKMMGPKQGACLARLEEEHENLRVGLDWSLSATGSGEALRFCGAMLRFWWTQGHLSEGRGWCAQALGKVGGQERTSARGKALIGAGVLARLQGNYASARTYSEESLTLFSEIGDRRGIANSLVNLGVVANHQGDFASARAFYEESLATHKETGERLCIASSLEAFAGLDVKESKSEEATALWAAADALQEEIGSPLPPNRRVQHDHDMSEVRQVLGEEAFASAWAKGRAMPMEQAVAYALGEPANG